MQDILNKILSNEEMAEKSKELKKLGKKVIMVNGVFDLLHLGHINFLRQAKEKGDILMVATNSDKSVKSYKGEDRPIILERDRAILLASLFFVDYVTIFNEIKALNIIKKIKPNILIKGIRIDEKRLLEEINLINSFGGKIEYIKNEIIISTGQIIDKIRGVGISQSINNSKRFYY